MRVRLFGRTNDDKGAQLEHLTKRLLERLGYEDVTLNFVGSGGSEVDIHGNYPLPALSGNKKLTLIGECKAYESPINLPDWLKFLGKVFTERTCRRGDTRAVFVALSGANGNVAGAYEEFRLRDESIELISGSKLAGLLATELRLGTIEDVQNLIGRLTNDAITEISLSYYAGFGYWIIEFGNATFTVLTGRNPQDKPPTDILELFKANLQSAAYRDLFVEEVAKFRHIVARKFVLGQLLTHGELTTVAWSKLNISQPAGPSSEEEIGIALDELRREGKVVGDADGPILPDLLANVKLRGEILRELVNGFLIFAYFLSDEWARLFDEALLDESLRIKDELQVPVSEKAKILSLLTWSPTALLWALTPDEVLCGRRNDSAEMRQRMQPEHARYYEVQIMQHAAQNFKTAVFMDILFERFGLRRMEVKRRVQFKSETKVEVELKLDEEFALARYDGGGIGLVWLVADAPQPWDAYKQLPDHSTDNG
jgi:Restriction endonuclease